ncbi:bifunctional diaminohydroxyphosphoribosylaminopyrimidine deaminase/5-amino-6-(5-phosphoribosylamino)uracil reductase RibD [Methylolobus aquaticus]
MSYRAPSGIAHSAGDTPSIAVSQHETWMFRAIELARRAQGRTDPNPAVGAVVVRSGRLLGEGFHERAGAPHAEPNAIAQARSRGHVLVGATLYVTLEPCSSWGRTPPCTDLIIHERLGRVVVGATDPNPRHRGRAYGLLRGAGIEVIVGVLAEACVALNPVFHARFGATSPAAASPVTVFDDEKLSARSTLGQYDALAQLR